MRCCWRTLTRARHVLDDRGRSRRVRRRSPAAEIVGVPPGRCCIAGGRCRPRRPAPIVPPAPRSSPPMFARPFAARRVSESDLARPPPPAYCDRDRPRSSDHARSRCGAGRRPARPARRHRQDRGRPTPPRERPRRRRVVTGSGCSGRVRLTVPRRAHLVLVWTANADMLALRLAPFIISSAGVGRSLLLACSLLSGSSRSGGCCRPAVEAVVDRSKRSRTCSLGQDGVVLGAPFMPMNAFSFLALS